MTSFTTFFLLCRVFNTTIFTENIHELPSIVTFFRDHADVIGLASFNLQAETGRGELGSREALVSLASVKKVVESVAKKPLPWDAVRVGHQNCHTYLPTLVVNKGLYPVVEDAALVGEFLNEFSEVTNKYYASRHALIVNAIKAILARPRWWYRGLLFAIYHLRSLGKSIFLAKGKVNKLTFFIQNFIHNKAKYALFMTQYQSLKRFFISI